MTELTPASGDLELVVRPELDLSSELVRRDMFCMHGVRQPDRPWLNSSIPHDMPLEDRFRTAIETRPTLSTVVHARAATTNHAPLWSSVGLVIAGGQIQHVSPKDESTLMQEDGSRQTPPQSADEANAVLDRIMEQDERYPQYPPHNEAVIEGPVIAGLYFKDTSGLYPYEIDQTIIGDVPGETVPELIRELSQLHSLPVFAIRHTGVFKVMNWDAQTGRYSFYKKDHAVRVEPADLASRLAG